MLGNTTNFVLVPKGMNVPPVTDSKEFDEWKKRQQELRAVARKDLDVAIQNKIKTELDSADPTKDGWQEKIMGNIGSMIMENAILKEKLAIVLSPCRSEEERDKLLGELITDPVLAACEKRAKVLRQAEAEVAAQKSAFEAVYREALDGKSFAPFGRIEGLRMEHTPAGTLVHHSGSGVTKLVPMFNDSPRMVVGDGYGITIFDDEIRRDLSSSNLEARDNALNWLRENGITAKDGKFYYEDGSGKYEVDFARSAVGLAREGELYRVAGKYFETGVEPSRYEALRERVMEGGRENFDIIFGGYDSTTKKEALIQLHAYMFGKGVLLKNNFEFDKDFEACIGIARQLYVENKNIFEDNPKYTVEDFAIGNRATNRDEYNKDLSRNGYYRASEKIHLSPSFMSLLREVL